MELGTNLSLEAKAAPTHEPRIVTPATFSDRSPGVRTQMLLVCAMAAIIAIVTALCLLLIRHRLQEQVANDLAQDLRQSVKTFQNLQAERLEALDRENALLAELPTLKALMTSGDDLTIQDGAAEFWQLSGNDLFAIADPNGRIVAAYTRLDTSEPALHQALGALIQSSEKHYLLNGASLYACSLRPLYFGRKEDGSLLGYVISGISIERTVRQISEPTGVDASFVSYGKTIVTTLSPNLVSALAKEPAFASGTPSVPSSVQFENTRFLAATEDLSAFATSPLQLTVLKSFEPAERWISRIDGMILSTGVIALLAGTTLMIIVARVLTRPLEELSTSVRAFGMGDSAHRIPRYGTQEVRELSLAFDGMRGEIQRTSQALLESERLATIGRMASSVSHDLRHYLAAVYANAEFLAADSLPPQERAEIFADIRTAVHGTTDMIESLLIFSRTGTSVRKSPELMSALVDRAVALARSHPDAEGIQISTCCGVASESAAFVDGKQIERAVYNLLLNACQAIRGTSDKGSVFVALSAHDEDWVVSVTDSGPGVPENIRGSLFDPFVSEGKQKGTGLGLTLAHCIAEEHG